MLSLPGREIVLLTAVIISYAATVYLSSYQLTKPQKKRPALLRHVLILPIILETALLTSRGLSIKAFPLTSLFESMLLLTLVFNLSYLILSFAVKQIWFSSAITWILLGMILLTTIVARPAARPAEEATRFWALSHGLAMILGAAMVVLAAVSGLLYLMAGNRLKKRQITKVVGVFPSLQRLQRCNLFALRAAFVLVSLGLASGISGAFISSKTLNIPLRELLFDAKTVAVGIVWILSAVILAARHLKLIRERQIAWISLVSLFFILFSFVGSAVLCKSSHNFPDNSKPVQIDTRE